MSPSIMSLDSLPGKYRNLSAQESGKPLIFANPLYFTDRTLVPLKVSFSLYLWEGDDWNMEMTTKY